MAKANHQTEKQQQQNLTGLTGSVSTFVTSSLDSLKQFVDQTTEEVMKADVAGANRRVIDQMIEGAKDTVTQVAECAARQEPMAAARSLATGVVENAKEAIRVATEESQRINLVDTTAKVAQEGLDLLKRQLDLGFEAGAQLGEAARAAMPSTAFGFALPSATASSEPQKRPGSVTRVEIETDKTAVHR